MNRLIMLASFAIHAIFTITGCGALGTYNKNDTMIEGVARVVDENSNPIEGAEIEILFTNVPENYKESGHYSFTVEKVSDSNGQVRFRENALSGLIKVKKEGFWKTNFGIKYNMGNGVKRLSDTSGTKGYYEIRVDTEIVLIKKRNPRPMYAGELRESLPELNTTYAYDMVLQDFLPPHGRGKNGDILFTLSGKAVYKDPPPGSSRTTSRFIYDVELKVHFPEKGDGIQIVKENRYPGTDILLDLEAPVEGYQDEWIIRRSNTIRPDPNAAKPAGYWFRVQTRTDSETGEVLGARYGKIKGDIRFGFTTSRGKYRGGLVFQYMLSPDEQKSVEYNGENLLNEGKWSTRGPASR